MIEKREEFMNDALAVVVVDVVRICGMVISKECFPPEIKGS